MERPDADDRPAAQGESRFDRRSVRLILERAAAEQHRLDSERADSYSLAELEEMASEAHISPQALRAALAAHAAHAPLRSRNEDRSPSSVARAPALIKSALLTAAGVVALFGLLLTFPVIAHVLLWAAVLFSVLVLLGASPF